MGSIWNRHSGFRMCRRACIPCRPQQTRSGMDWSCHVRMDVAWPRADPVLHRQMAGQAMAPQMTPRTVSRRNTICANETRFVVAEMS